MVQPSTATVAYHEAGHAVVAWRLCVPFRHVTIIPEEGNLGHVLRSQIPKWCREESDSYNEDRARMFMEKRVQVAFAGQIAQHIHQGEPPTSYSNGGDDQEVIDLAFKFGGPTREIAEAWLNWLFLLTKDVVESHCKPILAVANALLERKHLTKAEVVEVIDASDGLKPLQSGATLIPECGRARHPR